MGNHETKYVTVIEREIEQTVSNSIDAEKKQNGVINITGE